MGKTVPNGVKREQMLTGDQTGPNRVKQGQTGPNGAKQGLDSAKLGQLEPNRAYGPPGPTRANQGQLGPTVANWSQPGHVMSFI